MTGPIPLLAHRDPEAGVAWQGGRLIPLRTFLADLYALAERLPDRAEVFNLCTDRYRFLVGFGAALLRGQVSLLPSSGSGAAFVGLVADHARAYCLVDGGEAPAGLPAVTWQGAEPGASTPDRIPLIEPDALAAVAFTSGTTGVPQPHPKRFGTLVAGARRTGRRLGLDRGQVPALLATVPPQHMYGLETSILLPLTWGLATVAERPFFPADVAAALAALPPQTALVTTPPHIRALVHALPELPRPGFLLSATAPLSPELAAEAERCCGAQVFEIFGTTETGAIATRRPAAEQEWRALDGIDFTESDGCVLAAGGHLPEPFRLHDRLALHGSGRFTLLGRCGELLNIAGKRMAVGELTARLLALPGVEDAAILAPDEAGDRVERLAALVVAPGCTPAQLSAALRECVDPVFVPRPLKLVPHLPRTGTGKLPRAELLRLLTES